MKVNLYRNPRIFKNGKSPIHVSVHIRGKRIMLSTGRSCEAKNWLTSNKVGSREDGYIRINQRLKEIKDFLEGLENDVEKEQKPASYIKQRYKAFMNRSGSEDTKKVEAKSFLEVMKDWIQVSKTDVIMGTGKRRTASTINTYEQTYNVLKSFEDKKYYLLSFEGMNKGFYNAFFAFVTEYEGKSVNTFGKYITKLKTFLNWANFEQMVNPYFQKFHAPNLYIGVDFLTKDQLHKLYSLDLTRHKTNLLKQFRGKRYTSDTYAEKSFDRLMYVKDLFLFSCYTSLRYSDLMRLKKSNINNEWIIIKSSQKTGAPLYIPFYDDLYVRPVEIVSKYEQEDGLIFPLISNAEYNRYLKSLDQFLNIDFKLTSKVGRKTFVSYMMNERKLQPFQVMAATGHKKEESFARYFGVDLEALLKDYKARSVYLEKAI